MLYFVLLLVGFVLLVKGADYFVDGSVSVAYRFHVSTTIVGLTLVALGTSLPETAVSINASLVGSNALAISNVLGSNLFNILVVVGASAIIAPFVIPKEVINRDLGFNIFCSVLLAAVLFTGVINRVEGILFLLILAGYLWYLIKEARKQPEEGEEKEMLSPGKSALFILGGALAIGLGGRITVDAAREIAAMLGMSENLIGLTVVSVGTSLPELVTSVVAARKGESGLSIGNAIGSSILNILFILGLSAAISTLPGNLLNIYDALILCAVSVGMFVLAKLAPHMTRLKGALMIGLYVLYVIYIIIR